MNLNELSIVIVTYKSEGKIFSCLNSLPREVNIYVIENSKELAQKTVEEYKKRYNKAFLA